MSQNQIKNKIFEIAELSKTLVENFADDKMSSTEYSIKQSENDLEYEELIHNLYGIE